MRKHLKQLLALGLTGAMALSMAACGGSGDSSSAAAGSAAQTGSTASNGEEPVTIRITWWGGQSRHDYTQQLLDLYTSEHPNVTFEAVPSGWDGYFDKLATDTATGGMADIVQMDYMYIATYANNDSLADLSEFIADGTLNVDNVDESLLSSGVIDGKTVGIPLATSVLAMSANPSVLAEAGVEMPANDWTWEDFASIVTEVHEKTGKLGFSNIVADDVNVLSYWVRQHGGALFAEDNKSVGYDDDAIITEFFRYWNDLIETGAVPNPDEYEQILTLGKEADPIITDDSAFRQDWNNFTTIAANAGNDSLELVNVPVDSTNPSALWYKPGMFFSVAETSTVKKECAAFIDWFINSEEANDIIMGERGTPASSAIREYLVNSGKLSAQQVDMFNYATEIADYCSDAPAPDPAGISEINTVFKDIAYSVFYGQTTPEDAAVRLREEFDSILAANN